MFLKALVGLILPESGKIIVDGTDIMQCSAKELHDIRTLFGVMFQHGALFGLHEPLRQHRVSATRAHQETEAGDP